MSGEKFAHIKRDGWRIEITGDKYTTRRGEDVSERLKGFGRVPADHIVHAELWIRGEQAAAVSSYLAGNRDDALLHAFAIMTPGWELVHLGLVQRQCERWGLEFIPWCLSINLPIKLEEDQEGWVFKEGNNFGWRKWKPVKEIDLVVLDTTDGKGKHAGCVGALICGTVDGRVLANVGGMTDEQRWEMTLDDPTGKVVEVAYQAVGAQGKLRHPRFVRFRDDKPKEECDGRELC